MKKQNIIIFDFNRTLYDPDMRILIKDAEQVVKKTAQHYKLGLVSAAVSSRIELIKELGLDTYFSKVVVSKSKNKTDFEAIIEQLHADRKKSYVIGDRIKGEIIIGNQLDLQTIWFRAGKFADEVPESRVEQPKYTITKLKDVLKIVGAL
jgi:FMN phosphatase YigB (HAD superfamily)